MTPRLRFPIRFSRFNRVLMAPLGTGPGLAYVEVDRDRMRVKMGIAVRSEFDLARITGAGRRGYVGWAWGVHRWDGGWIVNGSGHNVVRVRIDPPARARVLGLPVHLRELWVSLNDPDGFLAAIGH